ncbi:MAG: ABC-F family ATP-binding cassette domain-containing protein [Desulfobacterales bacterium]|nr:ABC-F family ATP-binding cassette domain-containing protein [Desulfobacterales bacterium]
MSLANISNLSISFSGKDLFENIGFQVEPGQHIGLVGPNGSGKTTLLRLLTGKISPDKGEVSVARGTRIGYLPQDIDEVSSDTLLQSLLDAIPGRAELKQALITVEQSFSEKHDQETQAKLGARLAEIHQGMADLDMRFPPHLAEKVLAGLGFKRDDFARPLSLLSGGWKMRAALARLLYEAPDLLLLDEPTNHLDLPSVRWLEEFLHDFKGAMILICHDRDFLNRQIERTISFEPEGLKLYNGNYDFYVKTREEERKTLEARARNQGQKAKEAKKFIERFKAKASKARQAQSKIKLLDKMALVETYKREKTIHFSFPKVPRSGGVVATIENLAKSFGDNALYEDLNLTVARGERVAIIGPNGAGKTTLLRMLAGEMNPDSGRIFLGHGVTLSYYAQHHSEMLDPGKTIIEEVYQVVPHESVSFVRGICGAFLFPGDDVEKTVGVLSGGEKARVSLAKILVKPGNFLVMDEPTNHLDILSSEILIDALADFNGTMMFVSHNLSFVNRLATKIWDIREGTVIEYPGKLYEYYEHLSGSGKEAAPVNHKELEETTLPSSQQAGQSRKIKRREKAERRSVITAALKPVQDALEQMEKRIDQLEKRRMEVETALADPEIFKDKNRSLPLLNEYGEVKKKLEELMRRWEYKQEELEAAKEELGPLEGD